MILHLKFAGLKVMEKPLLSPEEKKENSTKKEKKEREKESAVSLDVIISLKDDILRIFKELSFGHFYMKLKLGLDDPAETGMLYGFFMALRGALYAQKKVILEVYPDFEKIAFEPECDCEILIKRVYRIFSPAFGIYRKISSQNAGKKPEKSQGGVLS